MKILYLGDNRPRVNWGCRGTSKALKDIFSVGNEIIYTIYGDITNHYDSSFVRDNQVESFLDRVRMSLYYRNHFRKYLLAHDPYNIINVNSVEKSCEAYKKMMTGRPPRYYREIDKHLHECDAVVCNGEGTFIFTNPANAKVFISGRWHPSILASIGGTPCVFMGSNSHKTLALQYMLEYPTKIEYSAIPNAEEIQKIVSACQKLYSASDQLRSIIIKKVEALSKLAMEGQKLPLPKIKAKSKCSNSYKHTDIYQLQTFLAA